MTMTDPCSAYRERLHLYFDGEMDAAAAREIEIHITSCAACRESLEEIKTIDRHLRAGLIEFVDGHGGRGAGDAAGAGAISGTSGPVDTRSADGRSIDAMSAGRPDSSAGLDRTIERLLREPTPRWPNVPNTPERSSRRRTLGWGALVVVGAAATLGILRISTITTAPERQQTVRPMSSAPIANAERVLPADTFAAAGFGDLSGDDLEAETRMLLAGPGAGEDSISRFERATRLRAIALMWERLALREKSSAGYRRAIDAYLGAISVDPRTEARVDSGPVRRLRQEAAAASSR